MVPSQDDQWVRGSSIVDWLRTSIEIVTGTNTLKILFEVIGSVGTGPYNFDVGRGGRLFA